MQTPQVDMVREKRRNDAEYMQSNKALNYGVMNTVIDDRIRLHVYVLPLGRIGGYIILQTNNGCLLS